MSHDATNWAVKQRGLRPIAKIVLWHLADCHNPTQGCFPTQEYLAGQAEVSRASVNRILTELEQAGIIRREPAIDPDTRRQLPTRYRLAFEKGFEPLPVEGDVTRLDTGPCLTNGDSRVSEIDVSVSHSSETLTSKLTSNGNGKASERVSFEDAWKAFPHRPQPNRTAAQEAWAELSDPETHRAYVAVQRFNRWHVEDSENRGETPESQLGFRPGMAKWIRTGAWIEALSTPLRIDPVAGKSEELVALDADSADAKAIARIRGKAPYVGSSGKITVTRSELEQARTAA